MSNSFRDCTGDQKCSERVTIIICVVPSWHDTGNMECSQSYENGKTTLADYHIFMEELGENIKEIGVDLEDADKNLLQK